MSGKSSDPVTIIIVGVLVVGLLWSLHSLLLDRDAQNQAVGAIDLFCSSRGGVGEDLTPISDEEAQVPKGLFMIECKDGSWVSGRYGEAEMFRYRDADGEEVDP